MSQWTNINNENDRFRLLCDDESCSLSLLNMFNGRVHVTSVHGKERHSHTLTHKEMIFIVSQYMKSLPREKREELLDFFSQF